MCEEFSTEQTFTKDGENKDILSKTGYERVGSTKCSMQAQHYEC